ncbi:MAG: hypothetical protein HY902_12790 [Deltaproteobacteria bacterium]|nr:hypothetical protein [Deltaproteobacteria bacterium]
MGERIGRAVLAGLATLGVACGAPEPAATADATASDAGLVGTVAGTPYPAVAATASLAMGSCSHEFKYKPLPWQTRPSSYATCYVAKSPKFGDGTSYPCLPWEFCDFGVSAGPTESPAQWRTTGSFRCLRTCTTSDPACPAPTSCGTTTVTSSDVVVSLKTCSADPNAKVPASSLDGAKPAEGGLDCWRALGTVPVAGQVFAAAVWPHVYVLDRQKVSQAVGSPTLAKLWYTTLTQSGAADFTALPGALPATTGWLAVGRAKDRLVAWRRPEDLPVGPLTLYTGIPKSNGDVQLAASATTSESANADVFSVPGSERGCAVWRQGAALHLACALWASDSTASVDVHTLPLPGQALADLSCIERGSTPYEHFGALTLAMGGGRIAMVLPRCGLAQTNLYVADFDEGTATASGNWHAATLPVSWASDPSKPARTALLTRGIIYRNSWLSGGLTAHLGASGAADFYAATGRGAQGQYGQLAVTRADDLVLEIRPDEVAPALNPARLWINRVLW